MGGNGGGGGNAAGGRLRGRRIGPDTEAGINRLRRRGRLSSDVNRARANNARRAAAGRGRPRRRRGR